MGECEKCGRPAPIAPIENLPVYRSTDLGELIFLGMNAKLCDRCARDYKHDNIISGLDSKFIELNRRK